MVYRGSFVKFLAISALTLIVVIPASCADPVSATRLAAVQGVERRHGVKLIVVRNNNGRTLASQNNDDNDDEDDEQIPSVVTITSDETPEAVYGTDDDQPLDWAIGAANGIETHAPDTDEPLILIGMYPPTSDTSGAADGTSTAYPTTTTTVASRPTTEDPTIDTPVANTSSTSSVTPIDIVLFGSDIVVRTEIPAAASAAPATIEPTDTRATGTPTITPVSTVDPTPTDDSNAVTSTPINDSSDSTPEPTLAGTSVTGEIETPAPTRAPGSEINPRLFGTKTVYWDQRNLFLADPSVQELNAKTEQELEGLTLLQVQQVTRHGTRFPLKHTMRAMQTLIDKLQRDYAASIPAWLRAYQLPFNSSIADTLATPGIVELEHFGARTREAIGDALPTEFANGTFEVHHTYKSRTKDAARAFAKGFSSNPQDVTYMEQSKTKDVTLRFFDACPRYIRDVVENASVVAEFTAFRASAQMVQNVEVLKLRLGLPPTANITQADLEAAYIACSFDISLYKTYSNWCSLLTKQVVDSIDFAEDLENFYEKGPGSRISYEIAAVLLKDIVQFMTDAIAGKTNVVGNFRFAHAETTLPLMVLLGYGDRTPLRATFTADAIAFRGFRSSVLAPLGANIDFRLYASTTDRSKHYVQVLVNEKVAPVPGCNGEVFCDVSTVARLWGYYLNDYDFDADCKLEVAARSALQQGAIVESST